MNLREMEQMAAPLGTHTLPGGIDTLVFRDLADLAAMEEASWRFREWALHCSGVPVNADGGFYSDAKQSAFTTAAEATVTLATTDKLIYPGSRTVISAANLFPGKIYEAYIYGTITTAATPGNLGVEIYWGSADAATTLLASSAALTLIASQTTIPFLVTARCQIRSLGSAAVVFCYGKLEIGAAVVAAGQAFIPASAPAAVTVDATAAASGLGVQMKRSGSTAETVTTQLPVFTAVN
jgi:hypothetical protein